MKDELDEVKEEVLELEEFFFNEEYELDYIDPFLPTKNY